MYLNTIISGVVTASSLWLIIKLCTNKLKDHDGMMIIKDKILHGLLTPASLAKSWLRH